MIASLTGMFDGRQYTIQDDGRVLANNGDGGYYGTVEDDLRNKLQWRLISRASDTQRYVVVTPTETAICTRAEAEDLASTGVDAVYKLGDKVEVTVKVEFNT